MAGINSSAFLIAIVSRSAIGRSGCSFPVRPHVNVPPACPAFGTDNLVGEPRHLSVAGIVRHVDKSVVSTRIVEAGGDQPVHPEMAHIVQGHRWAGWVLWFRHDVLLSTKEKAQPAGAGLV